MKLASAPNSSVQKTIAAESLAQLQSETEALLQPLGYEVVALEMGHGRPRKLTLFIDFLDNANNERRISLEDCVQVNHVVDALYENTPLLDSGFILEVSSPGIERPLRKLSDYSRFCGRMVRIHTFRPLDAAELQNQAYWDKNPRQKHFSGILTGLTAEQQVGLRVGGEQIFIPMPLVCKANLHDQVEIKKEQGQ